MKSGAKLSRKSIVTVLLLLLSGTSLPHSVASADVAGVPGPPVNPIVATRTATQFVVSWQVPAESPETVADYELQYSSDDGVTWTNFVDEFSTATKMAVAGLLQGRSYRFQVRSVSTAGNSIWTDVSSDFSAVSTGNAHTCALLTTGQIKCWGNNENGQLGDGTTTARSTPVLVTGITNAMAITTSYLYTCALLTTGQIKCWGRNSDGQLGDGTTRRRSIPVLVSGITNATAITLDGAHTCALLTTGQIKCWGRNRDGQLGDGTTTTRLTPVLVSGITNATKIITNPAHTLRVSGGHTCALLTTGQIKCWGVNPFGHGRTKSVRSTTPVLVTGITNATAIVEGMLNTCALLTTGQIKCWGRNSEGQLGDGTTTARYTPVLVTGITNATAITTGWLYTCALLTTGQIKCWGFNSGGQLGDGSNTNQSTPVPVTGITDATTVTAGAVHNCALLTTGQIKCWGPNNFPGRLGDGSNTNQSTPVLVTGITNATSVTASQAHTCALLTTGQIKCWGYNQYGQLGDGSNTSRSTPVVVSDVDDTRSAYYVPLCPSATTVTFQSRTASTITAMWTAPNADGLTVDNYKVEWSTNGATWSSKKVATRSATLTGLLPAKTYRVRVSAHSEAGWGTTSAVKLMSTSPI